MEWTDDSGKKWSGSVIRNDPDKAAGEKGQQPEANILQRRIEAALAWCRSRKLPARIIVLKGRRSGCSMGWAKVVDLECRRQPTKALVMADVFKRTDEIFDMLGQFAESDVFPWGFGVTRTQRTVEYGNGSRAIKETAFDPKAGRGGGFRVVWFSEVAHYPTDGVRDAKKLMDSAINTVPKTPGSIVGAESTANGCNGWFYERWLSAQWPEFDDYWRQWDASPGVVDPDEVWIRVFAAWFEIPRNRMAVTDVERQGILSALTPRETSGVARYQWTPEQIRWRRFTIRNDFNGNEEKFDQEYPSDPQSAFLATGSPAFSRDSLALLRTMAARAEPLWRHGVLEHQGASPTDVRCGKMRDIPISFRATPIEEAWVAMIEEPKDGCEYLMSIDPSSGLMVGDEEASADRSKTSILVFRTAHIEKLPDGTDRQHRARLVARIMAEVMEYDPSEKVVLYVVALLARHYGNCRVVIETNMGSWLIIGAKDAGLNLYRREILDQATNKTTELLGFSQNEETRHAIVTRFQSLVHGSEIEKPDGTREWQTDVDIEDLHLIGQMETFVRDRKGKYKAASGRKDDDVLAAAQGLYLLGSALRYRVRKRKRSRWWEY